MLSGYAHNQGTRIAYECLGDSHQGTLVFISGLGSQLLYWTDELCQEYISRGFQVIRFDNRDTGLSDKTPGQPPDMDSVLRNPVIDPPYNLSDMAADTIAVLDALDIKQAHLVGVSLGGMIAQTTAIEYPQRVHSLTSIMSAPSRSSALRDSEDHDDAVASSLTLDLSDPETYVDLQIEGYREISGPHFDVDYQRDIVQRSFDRCYHPQGWSYQMMAAIASGDRSQKLARLSLPALVIHGGADTLIPASAGKLTADAIPGAHYLFIEDMGHNLLPAHWQCVAEAIEKITGV